MNPIDNEKIGNFIKTLREDKNWSQEELASKVYVSRQAVSLWEVGKFVPDIDKIRLMAEIFNVSITEIYAGEKELNTKEQDNTIYNVIKKEHLKFKKRLIILISIILLLLLAFFSYYFINSYKSVQVYLLDMLESNYNIDGIMVVSKGKSYFKLHINNIELSNISLFYHNKRIAEVTNQNQLFIEEPYGYYEYFSNDINDFVNNLYLDIIDKDNNRYRIKLELIKDFENNNLIFKKSERISAAVNYIKPSTPKKILNNFNYDGYYNYHLSKNTKNLNISLKYSTRTEALTVKEVAQDKIYLWYYYLKPNTLSYYELDKYDNVLYKFDIDLDNNIKKDYKKYVDYFNKNYLNKYL